MSRRGAEYCQPESSGSQSALSDWIRIQFAVHRVSGTLCLAGGVVLAVAMAAVPLGFLSASPQERSAGKESSEMVIQPRGRDLNDRLVSPPRRAPEVATPRGPGRVPQVPSVSPDGRRALLKQPAFRQVEALSKESETTFPPLATGHSGVNLHPVAGVNFVDALGIGSLPYAGGVSRNSATPTPISHAGISRTPDETLGVPATPVPPAPVSPERVPTDGSDVQENPGADVPAGALSQSAVPIPPGTPTADYGSDPSNVEVPSGGSASAMSVPASGFVTPGTDAVENPAAGVPPQPFTGPATAAVSPGWSSPNPSVLMLPATGHSLGAPRPGMSGFRANIESDASGWMSPYLGRAGEMPDGTEPSVTPAPGIQLPTDFNAWWEPLVRQQAGIAPRAIQVNASSLVQQALIHSPQVQVLQAEPEVQNRVTAQEEAAFDWRAFLDGKYDDLSDPIGNTLTTGDNSRRFTDNRVNSSGGIKKRTETGGEVKLSQQIGHQYNNSRFLLPNPQSTTRLELSFRQPLLSRAGTVYNQNQIVLARISANAAGDETLSELQNHLYAVTEAYWGLYRARAEFFQRQKLLTSARSVLTTLEGRNEVDTIPRQILRARAAMARAESRMQRAVTDIRNSESRLRLLVNDPEMLSGGPVEFIPCESPAMMPGATGLRESLQTALVNRPDISAAIRQMRAAGVKLGVSKSEMLPKLDFIVSSYVAGLQNETQVGDALGDQFRNGRPGYTIGLEFEVPLGNRAARARNEQRQWELTKAINSFRSTVESSLTEVEIANRETDTAWRELLGKYQAMAAAQNEVSYLEDRFEVLPLAEESSMLLLEDLLDGYERLADEESAFAQAQANYALAIIQLRRATGTLMRSRYEAPELEPEENEWMSARADQTATEAESSRSRPSAASSSRPGIESMIQPASGSRSLSGQVAAPQPKPRPGKPSIGGHSFGHGGQ